MSYTTDGLVLRVHGIGENDKLLILLTPLQGRITVAVKGGRSLKCGSLSATQLFAYGNYEITVLSWAWRYGLPNGMVENSVKVNINTAEPFTFVYSGTPTDKWLTDDASGTVTPTVTP